MVSTTDAKRAIWVAFSLRSASSSALVDEVRQEMGEMANGGSVSWPIVTNSAADLAKNLLNNLGYEVYEDWSIAQVSSPPVSAAGSRKILTVMYLGISGSEMYADSDVREALWEVLSTTEQSACENLLVGWGYTVSDTHDLSHS